jgi:2-amino-4-hydroxy-6-hydroxymethyldihydropteridine diphosphokinase / dihydropteroate synthase
MHTRGTPLTMAQLACYAPFAGLPPSSPLPPLTGSAATGNAAPLPAPTGDPEAALATEEAGVVTAVARGLRRRAADAAACGIPSWCIILDPGLGFAKSPLHSFALLRASGGFRGGDWLEAYWSRHLPPGVESRISAALAAPAAASPSLQVPFPLLYGPSRKGFIGAAIAAAAAARGLRQGVGPPSTPADVDGDAREWGTAAAVTACIFIGADFVRVHRPEALGSAVAVADAAHRGFKPLPPA